MNNRAATVVNMPVSELKLDAFVRRGLNDSHVRHLMALVEAGVQLPPIEVTEETKTVVDGRHRIQVHRNLGLATIPTKLCGELTRAELLARALNANYGGALPMSNEDVVYVVDQMLDAGESKRAITERLSMYPPAMVKKYMTWCESNRQKRRMKAVLAAIADENLTVKAAADKYGVDVADIKAAMTNRTEKEATSRTLAANMERSFRSLSQRLRHDMQTALDMHDRGLLETREATHLMKQTERSAHRISENIKAYQERLAAQATRDQKALRPRLART